VLVRPTDRPRNRRSTGAGNLIGLVSGSTIFVVSLEDMLRATQLLHVIKPDRSANSGNDCEVAANFRIDARNEKLCEKSPIAEALQSKLPGFPR
jgi:hypothetical protein